MRAASVGPYPAQQFREGLQWNGVALPPHRRDAGRRAGSAGVFRRTFAGLGDGIHEQEGAPMENSVVSAVQESEKREALRRVLASNAFHRSEQLRALLRYICEREISGRGENLDEYTVAVEALGRSREYSAFEDGTARNRIHNLRRRLEHYYQSENPGDPVQILLPKGSYCPVFHRQTSVEQPEMVHLHAMEPPVPAANAHGTVSWLWAIILCAAAALAGAGIATSLHTGRAGPDPVLAAAWGPLLAKDAKPLICVGTAAQLTLIQRPIAPPVRPNVSSPDLLEWYNSLPGLPPSKGDLSRAFPHLPFLG